MNRKGLSTPEEISWILAGKILDTEGGEKRLPSLIVELFFSESILPALRWRGRSGAHAMQGWIRLAGKRQSAVWAYVSAGSPGEYAYEAARILEEKTKLPVLFFSYDESGYEKMDPSVSPFAVTSFSEMGLEGVAGLQSRIDGHRGWPWTEDSAGSPETGNEDQSANTEIQEFFSAYPPERLWSVLLSRFLLNVILKEEYPVDIDTLLCDGKDLHFVEFKRKHPARGCSAFDSPVPEMGEIVQRALRHKGSGAEEKKEAWVERPCYGLDISHLRNVGICRKSGFPYSYLIWKKAIPKDRDFMSQMKNLFRGKNVPRLPFEIYVSTLSPEDFCGLSSTQGPDSGSAAISSYRRAQAMIAASNFTLLLKRDE